MTSKHTSQICTEKLLIFLADKCGGDIESKLKNDIHQDSRAILFLTAQQDKVIQVSKIIRLNKN